MVKRLAQGPNHSLVTIVRWITSSVAMATDFREKHIDFKVKSMIILSSQYTIDTDLPAVQSYLLLKCIVYYKE